MRWVSVVGARPDLEGSLSSALVELQNGLAGARPDLLFAFVSGHHLFDFGRLLPVVRENLGDLPVVGCSAESVVGAGLELENSPGVSLVAAVLPDARIDVVTLRDDQLPPLDTSPQLWRDALGVDPREEPDFLVFGDPYSLDSAALLAGIDFAYPRSTVVGGLASSASGPGANALFAGDHIERQGAVIVCLRGDVRVRGLVSQGCRPIGAPARVSDCEGHLLKSLDGRRPSEHLQELFDQADPVDQGLIQRALQLGVLMDESLEEVSEGDFLIRNIMGMQQETGVIAVGSKLRTGQTVRFHVRDAEAASRDLHRRLERWASRDVRALGGLLQFSCVGRGRRLFPDAHHDARAIQEHLGPVPAGGFFANGEIGPVGGSTHVHGFSAALALFWPRSIEP